MSNQWTIDNQDQWTIDNQDQWSLSSSSSSMSSSSSSVSSSSSSSRSCGLVELGDIILRFSSSSSSSISSSSSSLSSSSSSISSSSSSGLPLLCDFDRKEFEDGCPVTYTYFFTGILSHPECITNYRWEVFDNNDNSKIAQLDSTDDIFIYVFPYIGNFTVKLTVSESCGTSCSIEKIFSRDPCPPVAGGGPSKSDWGQREEKEPCKINIRRVYFKDTEPPPEIKLKMRGGVVVDD